MVDVRLDLQRARFKDQVQSVLERVRPYLQSDGGDIQLMEINGHHASVRLTGQCAGCPSAHLTLYLGIEMAIKAEIPEFEGLELV
jgi:Fe-S cluster biogenesis protein NfuA